MTRSYNTSYKKLHQEDSSRHTGSSTGSYITSYKKLLQEETSRHTGNYVGKLQRQEDTSRHTEQKLPFRTT